MLEAVEYELSLNLCMTKRQGNSYKKRTYETETGLLGSIVMCYNEISAHKVVFHGLGFVASM
jgi:hypothetical protein